MSQASSGGKPAGVLQIPVSATQKGTPTPAKSAPKPPAPRLKLIVRRLPPGLTRSEFETGLGDDWKLGSGQVDWFQFKPGKISKDPAKPSRPARAYLHVLSEAMIPSLFEKVKNTSFHDARNSSNDPVLVGPPSVEFAPYARLPGSRIRKDGRQGTIDQDPDFVSFLESLTNPVAKLATGEADGEKKEDEEVNITPLVQYIKDKKANKAKEAASSKASKRSKEKEAKAEKAEAKKLLKRPDKESTSLATPSSPEKKGASTPVKVEKATKEAAKAANKQAAAAAKSKQSASKDSTPQSPTRPAATDRKRERGDVSAAAKILQRDLGLAPSGGRRRGKGAAAAADDTTKKDTAQESGSPTPTVPTGPKGSKQNAKTAKENTYKDNTPKVIASKANVNLAAEGVTPAPRTDSPTATKEGAQKPAKQPKAKQPPPVSPTATQAFVKHANPSQGVTEELLDTAFSVFGRVTKVEIDRKKGFGYVDFAEPDGLQKAIAASPVTVAQSQVVVLERKNPPSQAKAAKASDTAQPPAGATTLQQASSKEKRSRGTRSRGGRGQKKTAGAGEGDKVEKMDNAATSSEA
ncbi:Smg-4/UPF3 family-domain-containing protein [Talaromyces proteolyticus]|uniref:Smg-4/UPF3 family-domain-containing protein n=1 Tax=Talaromyces proteolyticus TaxID=1131652 RepID=A0AAD4Q138_9EURO|nr:Smg-4/UPF3 family-domain-containing protein [Talaromyces proteolyticus]KAH8697848.1 Smg-4/UPF3 family-domain-containing protein [Talaromyces proteolyticus]